jgi:hypothetical protein
MSDDKSLFYRYQLTCKYKGYEGFIDHLLNRLKENDIDIQKFEDGDNLIIALAVNNNHRYLKAAEEAKIKKLDNSKTIKPINGLELDDRVKHYERTSEFCLSRKDNFVSDKFYEDFYRGKKTDEQWGLGLFTEAEMLYLLDKVLDNITINVDVFLGLVSGTELEKKIGKIKLFFQDRSNVGIIMAFSRFKIIESHCPLHISNFREQIARIGFYSIKLPFGLIRNYYGDYVAIYYAWVYHYTRLLLYPSATAIICLILSAIFDNHKLFMTIYAMVIVIWSQWFLVYWNRKTSEIFIEWGNYTEDYDIDNVREQFKGERVISPVTEQYETQYPRKKKLFKYLKSVIKTIPFVLVAFLVNICFLNLSGFIKPEMNSLFEIEFLYKLSEKGAIFDSSTYWETVMGIFQAFTINIINQFYRKVAVICTDQENHKNRSNYDNSLIIKIFIFEFFDSFISLFYLAFVLRDTEGLTSNLVK